MKCLCRSFSILLSRVGHTICKYIVINVVGYYDANAYPAPSYYNPIPWHPIEIPEQKPSTKKKPVKIRVNRERYFWSFLYICFVCITVILKQQPILYMHPSHLDICNQQSVVFKLIFVVCLVFDTVTFYAILVIEFIILMMSHCIQVHKYYMQLTCHGAYDRILLSKILICVYA